MNSGRWIIMADRTIYITKFDMDRLLELIDGVRSTPRHNKANIDLLEKELYNGTVVDSEDVPADVITMNFGSALRTLNPENK